MNTSKKTLVAALLATMALSPAFADKGGQGKGGGKHDRVERVERHSDRHDDGRFDRHGRDGRFDRDDRVVILDRHHDRSCPPGLAKKNNGCLPPGQAKKANRVIIGEALPPGAVFTVPRRTLSTLPPPPVGYRYAVVNNQVVLVGNNSNIVVDIILRSLLG
jgi:Ni/Co efflux regulator RcnB